MKTTLETRVKLVIAMNNKQTNEVIKKLYEEYVNEYNKMEKEIGLSSEDKEDYRNMFELTELYLNIDDGEKKK